MKEVCVIPIRMINVNFRRQSNMVIAHNAVYPRVSTAARVCPQVGWRGLDEVVEPDVTPDEIKSSVVE